MCLNNEEPLFHSLITVWYVTVPEYHSGSRLHVSSLACVSPALIQGQQVFLFLFFLLGECLGSSNDNFIV